MEAEQNVDMVPHAVDPDRSVVIVLDDAAGIPEEIISPRIGKHRLAVLRCEHNVIKNLRISGHVQPLRGRLTMGTHIYRGFHPRLMILDLCEVPRGEKALPSSGLPNHGDAHLPWVSPTANDLGPLRGPPGEKALPSSGLPNH